jgi:hypothetical protein
MEKLTELLKQHPTLAGDLLKLGSISLRDAREDSYDKLRRLCRGKQEIMVHAISCAVMLGFCKRVYENAQRGAKSNKKNAARHFGRELKSTWQAILKVSKLDPAIDAKALMIRALVVLKARLENDFSWNLEKNKKEYARVLSALVDFLQSNTTHTKDATYSYLAAFLNSLGHTTLNGKRFTRQNIRKIHTR